MKEVFIADNGRELHLDVDRVFNTDFNGSTIYKGVSGGRELVVKFSAFPWGAQRELLGLTKAHEAGIPSPAPVAYIPGEKPGLAMEYIPGGSLFQDEDPSLRFLLGSLVRYMQAQVEIEGEEWRSYGKHDFSFHEKKIAEWEKNKVGGSSLVIMKKLGVDIGDTFREVSPVFLHNDLHDDQVIINDGGMYLIDFEFWREGHPLGELAVYLLQVIRNKSEEEYFWQLCRGYLEKSTGYSSTEKDILMFLLLFSSFQALEYFYNTRPNDLNIAIEQHKGAVEFFNSEKILKNL